MMSKPGPEHAWLQQLVGEWTYERMCETKPGEPPQKFTGTDVVRSIGPIWIQGESTGLGMDGSPSTALLTIGFDHRTQRYVGTWAGSMMDFLWVYDGSRSGDVLTLNTVGPNFDVEGATANYREVITLKSRSEREFESFMQGADGSWASLMKLTYHRKS